MCTHSRATRRQTLAALLAGAAALGLAPRTARAEALPVDLPAPGPRDICPVCGMFVAKYPEWIATVLFDDGHAEHFDGAKDFFKYLTNMEKYAPGRSPEQVVGMGVTEYYGVSRVDAKTAQYALGSDVLGPMGHELVPLASAADATDYMRDHAGKRLVSFAEVTPEMLAGLDAGRFE
ncbi:MAG: nitrous oxide reductase accessory protein NosL [Paracoccaceae bacterium]|jgi:nitrous oxide reductase accessory protein NosL